MSRSHVARDPSRGKTVAARPDRRAASPPASWVDRVGVGGLSALLFLFLMVTYLSNLRVMGAADSLPTRRLPFSILQEGNLDLDEFDWEMQSDGTMPYYLRYFGSHFYSGSPVATPLFITPLYLLPAWFLSSRDIPTDDVRARVIVVVMERLSAATMTALATCLLFAVLWRLVDRRWALGLALIAGIGSSSWSIASQALWPHAFAQLALALLCLLLLQREPSRTALVLAGLAASLAVVNRPPMLIFAALSFLYVWRTQRRHLIAFSALPALSGVSFVAYNLVLYQRLTGNYGVDLNSFTPSFIEGVAGLLVSPNRGLLVYSPIFVFSLIGAARVWRLDVQPWLRYLTVGLALHLLFYGSFSEWWAGYSYGPRYLTDVIPVLTLLLVPGLVPFVRGAAMRAVVAALAVYGIGVQAIGVYCSENEWNRSPVSIELQPERVWDASDLQIVRALRNGWHGTELAPLLINVFRDPAPALLRPLSEDDLAAEFTASSTPAEMRPGEEKIIEVQVTNRAQKAWPAFSGEGRISIKNLVLLVLRWEQDGRPLPGVGDVLRLPSNVSPGETLRLPVKLVAPARPGTYEADLRLSQAVDRIQGLYGTDALRFPVVVR